MGKRDLLLRLGITTFCAWAALSFPQPSAAAEKLDELRSQARQFEKEGDWAKACTFYAYILSKDRGLADVKERFQTCLRHFHRVRRHQDLSYRDQVLSQDVTTALKAYGEVLSQLRAEYIEEDRADVGKLFQNGLNEFRLALQDDAFCRQYLADAKKETVQAFVAKMSADYHGRDVRSVLEAQGTAFRLALAARKALGLKPTVTVLELACGACNALDEHTYYMTPRQYGEDFSALRGESVGIGVELALEDGKLIVANVFMNSPAFRAGIVAGDQLTRIDKVPIDATSLEAVADKLKGKAGTPVELELLAQDRPKVLTLVRQPVSVSIAYYRIVDPQLGVGYVQLVAFHERTAEELDEVIRQLEALGMKSLILDLRGNPGGLFDGAVQVAERFLWEGSVIVGTRGRLRDAKRISRNPNPYAMPLVVLVDHTTASAAEIVAGALKENLDGARQSRGLLVGQTTFGKGSIQHLVEIKTVQAGGIRITWAKFFSPLNHPYQGLGVEPHFPVVNDSGSMAFDDQLQVALQKAQDLARPFFMMPR